MNETGWLVSLGQGVHVLTQRASVRDVAALVHWQPQRVLDLLAPARLCDEATPTIEEPLSEEAMERLLTELGVSHVSI